MAFLIGLFSCVNKNVENKSKTEKTQDSLITKYTKHLSETSGQEKVFTEQLIKTIKSYQNKDLDTTILTICKIDTDEPLDTIKTRVYEESNVIKVYYSWNKNGKRLWEEHFDNLIYSFEKNDFFVYNKLNKWEQFTVGIYHASPDIYEIERFKPFTDAHFELGTSDLKEAGLSLDTEIYRQYVNSFNGKVIVWGNPEFRGVGYIWYEPLMRFVKFHVG